MVEEWKDFNKLSMNQMRAEVQGKAIHTTASKINFKRCDPGNVKSTENFCMRIPSTMVASIRSFDNPLEENIVDNNDPFPDLDEIPLSMFVKQGEQTAALKYQDKVSNKKEIFFHDTAEQQKMKEREILPNVEGLVFTPTMTKKQLDIYLRPQFRHNHISQCDHKERVQLLEKIITMEEEKVMKFKIRPSYKIDVGVYDTETEKFQVMVTNHHH